MPKRTVPSGTNVENVPKRTVPTGTLIAGVVLDLHCAVEGVLGIWAGIVKLGSIFLAPGDTVAKAPEGDGVHLQGAGVDAVEQAADEFIVVSALEAKLVVGGREGLLVGAKTHVDLRQLQLEASFCKNVDGFEICREIIAGEKVALEADAVDQGVSLFIHEGGHEGRDRVGFILLVVVIVIKIDGFGSIFVRKVERMPQVVVADDLVPIAVAHGAVLVPCLVDDVICIKKILVTEALKLIEGALDQGFHAGEHFLTVHKALRHVKILVEDPIRRLAVPDQGVTAHGKVVVLRPFEDELGLVAEFHDQGPLGDALFLV